MERRRLRSLVSLMIGILVLAMVIALTQTPAYGAVDCATASNIFDSDGDGFTDAQECAGIMLMNQTPFPGKNSGLLRANRLDPDTKDLFVILMPAQQNSNFPVNPLEYVVNTLAAGGLAITLHEINAPQADTINRIVSPDSTQKAIKIIEDLDPSGTLSTCSYILGLTMLDRGTPNNNGTTWIYTERIKIAIACKCPGTVNTNKCVDNTGLYGVNLTNKYIKQCIAHETGHMVFLGTTAGFGGYHYDPGDRTYTELDQFVVSKTKSGITTFYIGTGYTPGDQSGFKLK